MKPPPFRYVAPRSLEEAVYVLAERSEDAKVLAGGQSLVPLMNLRLASPAVLVDLNPLRELGYVRPADGAIAIGAMTRHHDVATDPVLAARAPIVAAAAALIGYPAIRYRGTIGGSLAHADPVSEMPCVATALEAVMVATGPAGRREIPADGFFRGPFTTALEPSEVLTEVRFPAAGRAEGCAFEEFARKTGDYPLVAVAARIRLDGERVERARIALAGVGPRPVRAVAAESLVTGADGGDAVLSAAAHATSESVDRTRDDPGYRQQLARTLTERALRSALDRAREAA